MFSIQGNYQHIESIENLNGNQTISSVLWMSRSVLHESLGCRGSDTNEKRYKSETKPLANTICKTCKKNGKVKEGCLRWQKELLRGENILK